MKEKSNSSRANNVEINYGLDYAERLILEIQKPKIPSSKKNNIQNLSKNNPKYSFDSNSLYKDPKVRIKSYLNLNRIYAFY